MLTVLNFIANGKESLGMTKVEHFILQAHATTSRQIAIAEHQARVMDELAATMENILRLLAGDKQQPPPRNPRQ